MGVTVAISSCELQLEVAVRREGAAVASVARLAGISPRSTLLVAALDLLMEDAGEPPSAIETIAVSRGPGSFTGIRSGLATAAGLAEATGAARLAYDSLLVQAARCAHSGVVWTAQPGRRGEVYARSFRVASGRPPEALGEIEILPVGRLEERSGWVAPECLDIGGAERFGPPRSAAEALIELAGLEVPTQPVEPLYLEGPPIHRPGGGDG